MCKKCSIEKWNGKFGTESQGYQKHRLFQLITSVIKKAIINRALCIMSMSKIFTAHSN